MDTFHNNYYLLSAGLQALIQVEITEYQAAMN